MALRLALERADRVSEAFEVLAGLVESEMSLLLANCQVAGLGLTGRGGSGWDSESSGNTKDLSVLWKRATERRRSAENIARSLLSKYDRERDNWEDSGRHTKYVKFFTSDYRSVNDLFFCWIVRPVRLQVERKVVPARDRTLLVP